MREGEGGRERKGEGEENSTARNNLAVWLLFSSLSNLFQRVVRVCQKGGS